MKHIPSTYTHQTLYARSRLIMSLLVGLLIPLATVYGYNLPGGGWSDTDIGNLAYHNFTNYTEYSSAASSWNNAGTKAKYVSSTPFSAFIFFKSVNMVQ
jgi:hypothetical protein